VTSPSPLPSSLLSLPGAVAGDGVDAPVAAHYGSFNREQRGEHIRPNRDHLPAIPADQVEVLVVAHRVVRRGAVGQVRVPHQPELLEHLEGAVDGRDVQRRRALADLREHLVRRRVAEGVDGVEDQLPLRGEPVALLAEPLSPVGGHCLCSLAQVCGWSTWPIAAMS
jgi:hypothetical protein